MDRPVERGVAPGFVRQHRIFIEAAPRVLALALEHDIGAEREMMRHVAAVAINRGGDLGDAGLLERAARRLRLANVGELEARRRREAQSIALRHEPGRVAHRGHLDAGLGAVDEAVEHLWIDRIAIADRTILVENVPHGVRRGAVIVRLVTGALAGGDDGEAAGARPVDMLANKRGLIAPGEAIDHAGGFGLARKQRTGERIRLDIDHDHMLAVRDRTQGVTYARARDAGRLDDHLDLGKRNDRLGVLRHMRPAIRERFPQRGRANRFIVPPGSAQLATRARRIEIGNREHAHSAR